MQQQHYTGRFAPTPSGPLHFGSIVAALGSYLQAKKQRGNWLVRIDDVDTIRARSGADTLILKQLEQLGLYWDKEIVYQSLRGHLYSAALAELTRKKLMYACCCSRKEIANRPYPGTCREARISIDDGYALRLKVDDALISVNDQCQASFSCRLMMQSGDFILKRSDGLFAYHLAAVIDDAEQQVTEIVRGADLLASTPAQIYLQQCLDLTTPAYLHLPVAVDASGKKLSKTDQAVSVSDQAPESVLRQALIFLGQTLPEHDTEATREELLDWAVTHWDSRHVPRQATICVA